MRQLGNVSGLHEQVDFPRASFARPRFPASGAVAYTVVGNEGLDAEIIRRLIGTAVYTVDHYFPAMMSIIYGNELPEDAIRHVEQSVS